jgi:hypothetical protein
MVRIKIKDLPENQKVSQAELKKVLGGVLTTPRYGSLSVFDFGTFPTTLAGCGCTSMPADPKEAGC